MEKTAYAILLFLAILWLLAVIAGLIVAFPYGLLGLLGLLALGLLFSKAVKERMANKEDAHYSNTVDFDYFTGGSRTPCLRYRSKASQAGQIEYPLRPWLRE